MAIQCKLCGAELEALAGARCRKCGKLVCGQCLSPAGDTSAGDGAPLCRDCAAAGSQAREDPPPRVAAKAPGKAGSRVPRLAWVAFGLFLLMAFAGIAYYPLLQARVLARRLVSSDRRVAAAAAADLERMGTTPALRVLADAAQGGASLHTRLLATEALGRIPHPEAKRVLMSIIAAPDTAPVVRGQARESLAMQERMLR